jgi:hypothetical protein
MERGDVLVFDTENELYKDWKYFRIIDVVKVENREEDEDATGAKMYFVGNILTRDDEVKKQEKIFIKDFLNMMKEEDARYANEADQALLFLRHSKF